MRNKKGLLIITASLILILGISLYGSYLNKKYAQNKAESLVKETTLEEKVNQKQAKEVSDSKHDFNLIGDQKSSSQIEEDNLDNLKKVLEYISEDDQYNISKITESSSMFTLDYDETSVSYAVPNLYRKDGEKFKLLTKYKSSFVGRNAPIIASNVILVNYSNKEIKLDKSTIELKNESKTFSTGLNGDNVDSDFIIEPNSFKEVTFYFNLPDDYDFLGFDSYDLNLDGELDNEKFITNVQIVE